MRLKTRRYEAGERHPTHRDRHSRLSFLLQGAFAEDSTNGAIAARPGDLLYKGEEVPHETRFGADGALIASVELPDGFSCDTRMWRLKREPNVFRESICLLESASHGSSAGVAGSILSLLSYLDQGALHGGTPQRWILRLKEELESVGLNEINITDRAKHAGIHPVHASRQFRRHFGLSITEHARLHSVRRAVALIAQGKKSLKDIAVQAGFYDQSHMNRMFNRVTGRTPQSFRKLCNWADAEAG
jgi:AraC family transcriptional regulator